MGTPVDDAWDAAAKWRGDLANVAEALGLPFGASPEAVLEAAKRAHACMVSYEKLVDALDSEGFCFDREEKR